MGLLEIAAKVVSLLGFLGGAIAATVKAWKGIKNIVEGIRCQLRSEMLRTYYHNKDRKTMRQYEKENFILCYKAYRALKGNSFIEDVYKDVMEWGMET